MKKTIFNGVMVFIMLGIVIYGGSFVKRADADTVVGPNIQDPLLLEAWMRLDQHRTPVQLWDGGTLTGHALAQYLREHAVPVVWNTDHACRDGSCSLLYCSGEACAYDDGKSGVDPIYISPTEAQDMQSLVATLAHETFHRMQPFGAVRSTRFEEYWAFFIGAQITQAQWPTFDGYDPLISGYLTLWIRDHNLPGYYKLQDYPAAVASLVESANQKLGQANRQPAAIESGSGDRYEGSH